VHDWPSRNNTIGTRDKLPSEVTYQEEGIVWGSLIEPDVPRHMWTKLQLETSQTGEATKIFQETSTSASACVKKQPVDIIADFLSQVKAHLITNLDKKFGKILWRTLPITLVVTVPAVWSDKAKPLTLEAVNKAGFNSLEFPQTINTVMATEPEAAAIHTIKNFRGTTQDTKFAVGDAFIVCDMGGGTIDLIAYKVVSLNPTVIEEATVGTGAQCGGSFVDRAFLEWLEKRLGSGDFTKIAGCRSEQVPRISLNKKAARMLQTFRLEVKGGFSGTETNFIQLPNTLSGIEDKQEA
jgi:molecular chaperone DnaK (HSP70)